MYRWFCPPALAILAGCWMPRLSTVLDVEIGKLQSAAEEERVRAFQNLIQAGPAAAERGKLALELGARHGFPLVAVVYAHGEGDAVPLELRARHLAAFQWPRSHQAQNSIVEPYTWNEIERDLVHAGRPALRLLADALAKEAPTEEKALQGVRVMLRIGGRAAADEFARLLEVDRALDGVRVCDVAAGALLYLGRQEMALRHANREALVQAARAWWEKAKDRPEDDWIRAAVADLVAAWRRKDPEGVRPVLELLVGETIQDPREWREKNPDWAPAAGPLRAEDLLPLLAGDRPAAYDANRRLEALTGVRLHVPRATRLNELCAALRLWQAPPGLEAMWRRFLRSPLLRLSVAIVGYHPKRGTNHVLMAYDKHYHSSEDETATVGGQAPEGGYFVYLQTRDMGTRLFYSEYFSSGGSEEGYTTETSVLEPFVVFSEPLKSCTVVAVEEVPSRRPPRTPEEVFTDLRARLRALAERKEGDVRRKALRALGYCQDRADLEFLKSQGAGEALLLLGDPQALTFQPRISPHEIEMALRKAEDPRVRGYLEKLRGIWP